MKANSIFNMAALVLGMTISSVMITSCTAEDNPVGVPGDVPNVGATTVKELSELTTAELGWVIAADGKAYLNSAAAKAAGTEALAMVGFFEEDTNGGINGLAIQITDCPQEVSWEDAKEYVKTLPTVEGATWSLPSLTEWKYILAACSIDGDFTETVSINKMSPINGFRDKIAVAGMEAMGWRNKWCWTSTEEGSSNAWIVAPNILWTPSSYALFNNEPKSYPYCACGFLHFKVK